MLQSNPFKPTAGAEPPVLIGRDKVIDDFKDALAEGVGARGRLMRITGPRGSGKTVLLTELGELARAQGWTVADTTAGPDLLDSIREELEESRRPSVSIDAGVGLVKAHVDLPEERKERSLRAILSSVAHQATEKGKGLLVTVDEIQDAQEDDVRAIAAAVQHLIRERQNVAFLFAGLTTGVMDLLNGKALTFLRRAKSEELGAIPLDEVATALRATIEKAGMTVEDEALARMTNATAGYAYLIQLVGYHVWNVARKSPESPATITTSDALAGVEEAMLDFNESVHEPAIADLPLRCVQYLLAMTEDRRVSSTADIAQRLGEKASSLTSYRRLLVRRQVIEPTARGYVAFSIPFTREFLQSNAEALLARYGL